MNRWVNRIREPAGAIPASARKLLVWGGGGALVLAVGWSTWQQDAASPPPPPNPAEAQPPPTPEVMDLADTSVRSSLRELDEQERLQALQEADRRLRDQKRQRALQQAVGQALHDMAIFEEARLTLLGIDDQDSWPGKGAGTLPLAGRREVGAAPSLEARFHYAVNDIVGGR